MFKINLERFDARELGALLALATVCIVVTVTVIGMLFRPPHPDGREALYHTVSGLTGLAAGLLGGGAAGFALAAKKAEKEKETKDERPNADAVS